MIKRYIFIASVVCLVVIILISGILLSWVHRIETSLAADDTTANPSEPAPAEEWVAWTNGVLSVSYPESHCVVAVETETPLHLTITEAGTNAALPRLDLRIVDAGTWTEIPSEEAFSQFALDMAERYYDGGLPPDATVTAVSCAAAESTAVAAASGTEFRIALTGSGNERLLTVCLLPAESAEKELWLSILGTAALNEKATE